MVPRNHEGGNDLTVSLIGNPHDRYIGDPFMREQAVLDLKWVDVLTAADD